MECAWNRGNNPNPEVITTLVRDGADGGADVNSKDIDGETALMYAAERPGGWPDCLVTVIEVESRCRHRDSERVRLHGINACRSCQPES